MLQLHKIGVSLCDMKGANVLVKYDLEKMGYAPLLTDLGGVYCKRLDENRVYGQFHTPFYFDQNFFFFNLVKGIEVQFHISILFISFHFISITQETPDISFFLLFLLLRPLLRLMRFW